MKTVYKIAIIMIVMALPLVFWKDVSSVFKNANAAGSQFKKEKDEKNEKSEKIRSGSVSTEVKVVDKWEMPSILTEISGIEYLGDNRFACIQDELGTIFIYNTGQDKIEKQIPFAGPGDYEGITIVETTAYVVRSDGKLFEVGDYEGAKPVVKHYATHLTDHNVEGLCYDKKNNRLLLASKDNKPKDDRYKGIYAFDLASKKMATEPVMKIDLADPVFKVLNEKKFNNVFKPSEIEINPLTGEIYIIEGTHPKLLIMDASGNKKKLFQMSSSQFRQAEGMTFTPRGELFISNEGRKGKGNILKVEINDTN